eukprot:gene1041-1606_t
MKRNSRRSSRDDNRVLIAGIVIVVVLFYGAYSYGLRSSATVFVSKAKDLRKQEQKLRELQAECTAKVKARGGDTAEEINLEDQNNALDEALQEINDKRTAISDDMASCELALSQLNDEKQAEAAIPDFKVAEARDNLALEIARNSGNSSKVVLLFEILRMLMADHESLYPKAYPKASGPPPRVRSKTYQMEIVNKWAEIEKEMAKSARENPSQPKSNFEFFARGRDEVRKTQRVVPHRLDAYDLDPLAKSILWLEKTPVGWPKPQWKGITQNRKKEGVLPSSVVPTSDVNSHIRKTLNFLTCSAALNISSLMFPNTFKLEEDAKPELLSNYIDTPVFAFCTNCAPIQRTDEFHYLCEGNRVWDQYGSALYWRIRSRMKYKDATLDDAEDYIETTMGSRVNKKDLLVEDEDSPQDIPYLIGVVVPKPPQEDVMPKATVLYKKVLQEVHVPEICTDEEQQRTLPVSVLADTLGKRVSDLKAQGKKNVKVYVSAQHYSYNDWEAVRGERKLKNLHTAGALFYSRASTYTSTGDLKDTMVTAWCDEIIIGRYDQKSLQVGENFLLSNRLNTSKISV